ncbi:MAG: hypothetical protein U0269_24725 [Polyangiales bacterium]
MKITMVRRARGAALFSPLVSLLALANAQCSPRPFNGDVTPTDAVTMDRAPGMDSGPGMDGDSPPDAVADTIAPPIDVPTITDCANATGTGMRATEMLGNARASIVMDGCLRRYRLEGMAPERDPFPGSPREWTERADAPRVRTRNTMFDALYSLAVEEARLDSVAAIRDGSFNNGAAIPCPAGGCFETGQLWNYVWTRDTSFSVDLGLAAFDPVRARNSLSFKLSPRRDGSNEQVVQDTGTGGSYPVSTDRVAWSVGASSLIPWLSDADRAPFDERAFNALRNTAEHDRLVAFDSVTGLYRGEHSFLDWREQSYPAWTAQDNAHIAMSHSLATNVLHWAALDFVARGATARSDMATAARFTGFRDQLAASIRARFWLSDERTLAGFTTTALDPSPVRRLDALATALAVSLGVVTGQDAANAVANYPFGPFGPPVIHPQQQQTPIYHNRAAWPFVTAYMLRAATEVRNHSVANASLKSLMEAAARFRTNAENYEFVTGRSRLEDGAATGPVVNSPRQLWSVGAYVGAVQSVIFGLQARGDSLRVRPFVTAEWRRSLFDNAEVITLEGVRYRGATLTVELALPPVAMVPASAALLRVANVSLDGMMISGDEIQAASISSGTHRVRVQLEASPEAGGTATQLTDTADYRRVFGPRTPNVTGVAPTSDGSRLSVRFDTGGETAADVTFDVYRNGTRVATDLPGTSTSWDDATSTDFNARTYCYSVSTTFRATGTRSQHASPSCYWGRDFVHVHGALGYDFANSGGTPVVRGTRAYVEGWGDNGHTLTVNQLRANATGPHLLQVSYSNGAGGFTTGITCAVKRVTVFDAADGTEVARGVFAMPQTSSWDQWRDSTFVRANLTAGRAYRVVIGGGTEAVNMSAFLHFNAYTGGTGGMSGEFNRVNISELRVLPMEGLPRSNAALVAMDGNRDYDDFAMAQRSTPGIRLDTWDAFALDWDNDYVYLAMASPAFELSRDKPLVIYLQNGASPAGAPRAGLTYSAQTPNVAFAADFAIVVRRQSDVGDGAGPFNGVFAFDGGRWVRSMRFVEGRHFWVGSDMNRTLSVRIPRAQLGLPSRLRLAAHVVNGGGNYNDVLPSTHTPWTATGGGYFEIDLSAASHSASGWTVR